MFTSNAAGVFREWDVDARKWHIVFQASQQNDTPGGHFGEREDNRKIQRSVLRFVAGSPAGACGCAGSTTVMVVPRPGVLVTSMWP